MDIAIDADEASQAQVYLRAMAAAIEGVAHAASEDHRRMFWTAYVESEAKLGEIIPPHGDSLAEAGPYTSDL